MKFYTMNRPKFDRYFILKFYSLIDYLFLNVMGYVVYLEGSENFWKLYYKSFSEIVIWDYSFYVTSHSKEMEMEMEMSHHA